MALKPLKAGLLNESESGKSFDVSEVTVGSWMERLREFCKGYQLKDIWNMDESGCFFKAFPSKDLAQKGKKCMLKKLNYIMKLEN